MCGLVSIFNFRGDAPVSRDELRRIRDRMAPRGPDGSGEWFSDCGRVGMGHRRLSIIDLSSAASQPMIGAHGTVLVFNGEIYNYRELRQELTTRGYHFFSQSDTEVLLHLYQEYGAALVEHLRGMFAFVLWDENTRSLLLGRDPLGIKPLYYSIDAGTIRVASTVKALSPELGGDPSPAGVVGFLLWGHVPEPYTLHRRLRSLPAGSTIEVTSRGPSSSRSYWSCRKVYDEVEPRSPGTAAAAESVRSALLETVRYHLVSDVPVGIFLSSGVDSCAVTAAACELALAPVRTVTLAFDEFRGTRLDESPLAEEVARRYGAQHTTVNISRAAFLAALPALAEAMDQPSVDGINTYFVSQAASRVGLKVALSGLGGDELFGGYQSFRRIPQTVRWLGHCPTPAWAAELFRRACWHMPLGRRREKLSGVLRYGGTYEGAYFLSRALFLPWELDGIISPELVRLGLAEYDPLEDARRLLPASGAFAKVACLEQGLYMRNQLLRDSDWAGMAHSLEIRVPLVDRTLLEQVGGLLAQTYDPKSPKRFLVAAARPPQPNTVGRRPKTGFMVPMADWLDSDDFPRRNRKEPWARVWARASLRRWLAPEFIVDSAQ